MPRRASQPGQRGVVRRAAPGQLGGLGRAGRRSAGSPLGRRRARPAPAVSPSTYDRVEDLAARRRADRRRRAAPLDEPASAPSSSGRAPRRALRPARRAHRPGRAATRSGCGRGAGSACRAARSESSVRQCRGDDAFDVVVLPEQVVGLGEHLGAGERAGVVVVRPRRRSAASPDWASCPASASRAACRSCSPATVPAGGDAPQGDLDDVLAAPRPVALDDVGQLLLDPPEPQRRHARPQHLAVQRVRQAHRRAPAGDHHRRPAARPPAAPAWPARGDVRGRRARSARRRRAARAPPAPPRRRRRGARRPARRAPPSSAGHRPAATSPRSWTRTPRSVAPRTSSVSTCRLPPDSRANSSSAAADTGWSRARCSSAPSSSGPERGRGRGAAEVAVALEPGQARRRRRGRCGRCR